jgi:rubrerythrin
MENSRQKYENALYGELIAAGKYNLYAGKARSEGLSYYADIFDELAGNELAHAYQIYKLVFGKNATIDNLRNAINGETAEFTKLYPELAELAVKENNLEAARIFKQIGKIEEKHSARLEKMLGLLENDMVYRRNEKIQWKCDVCGYTFEGKSPPAKCPACTATIDHYFPRDLT